MAEVNLGFQVLPLNVGNKERLYSIVDNAIKVVQESGVKHEVGALETVMEGDLDNLMEIVKKAIQSCVDSGAEEVMTNIKLYYRPAGGVSMDEKLEKYR